MRMIVSLVSSGVCGIVATVICAWAMALNPAAPDPSVELLRHHAGQAAQECADARNAQWGKREQLRWKFNEYMQLLRQHKQGIHVDSSRLHALRGTGWPLRSMHGGIEIRRDLVVPHRPLWLGFSVDATLFTAMIVCMRGIFYLVRRDMRRIRNRCPRCAYDLRGSCQEGCPECGWNR